MKKILIAVLLLATLCVGYSTTNKVTLAWDASTDVNVIGYKLYHGISSRIYTNSIDVANLLTATISNLVDSTTYYFAATAYTLIGLESDYSNEVSYTTPGVTNQPPVPTNSNISVVSFPFNEGTGATTLDVSTNAIIGTLNSVLWTNGGRYGNAVVLNGNNGTINLGNPNSLKLTGSMTVEAWVRPTMHPWDDGQIVSKSAHSPNSGWQFKTSPDTGVRTFAITISPDGNSSVQRYSQMVYSLNTWYHVAGVYNATAQTLDIYVNGVLNNGILSGIVPSSQFNSSVDALIGSRAGNFFFGGTIDEVRIYNRAITQAEIQFDMNNPIGTTIPLPPVAPEAPTNPRIIKN